MATREAWLWRVDAFLWTLGMLLLLGGVIDGFRSRRLLADVLRSNLIYSSGLLLVIAVVVLVVIVFRWRASRKEADLLRRNPLTAMIESGNYQYGVGDNPLTDMFRWGKQSFPPDIEELLRKISTLDTSSGGRVPIWQNWPYRGREWSWASGRDLDGARRDLRHLLTMIEAGRGDEILVDPITGKPLRSP
jgi:hypothetical protein